MRILLGLVVLATTLVVLQGALEEQPNVLPVETLKQLSLDGEKLVDAEVKRALYGVKDIKEVMRSNELKHQHLMKSLRRSSEKKEGAAQLKQEVTEKLIKAEQKCRDSLQSEWEQCRPCLEEACKSFYTSTCRRGFASFRAKAQSFFHRVSRRSVPQEPTVEAGDIMVNQEPGIPQGEAAQAALIEASFSQLMRRVGGLVGRSRTLVERSRSRLDDALRGAFFNRDQSEGGSDGGNESESADPASPGPFDPAHDSGFLQGVGLEEVLDSFYDFGRSVVEEFGAVVATKVLPKDFQGPEGGRTQVRGVFPRYQHNRKLCRDLRRQTSECWQLQHQCEVCQGPLLKECPSVRELHVALEEASQLLEVCREQYEEILTVVQRHTDQTLGWLGDMAAEYSWVAPEWTEEGSSSTTGESPWNMFRITTVLPKSSGGEENANTTETEVQVTVLNSAPLTFSVPGELKVQDPGFLQYVTQEALDRYKDMVRLEDE